MLNKLQAISDRLEAVVTQMEDPATYADPDLLRRLTREQKELEPVVEAYRAYGQAEADLASAQELLSDPEMKEMAQEEIQRAKADMERLREELKLLLLPRDPNDGKNVVMEIRGGVGGEEAMLFAADLFRMYVMYVESRSWSLEVTSRSETELGGIKTIEFIVEGEGAWSRLKYESGTHRVQRVPVTESSGRIQTSAATVAVLPEAEEVDVDVDPKDLQIDTYRSSGAGGQHINKTESAIRITHLPTGTVVTCQDERSQYKNRDKAMRVLRSRLYQREREKRDAAAASERKSQVGGGWRSEKIRTYRFLQSQVVEHRIGLTLYRLDAVLNGDLDEIIDALAAADTAERLKYGDGEQRRGDPLGKR